MTTVLIVDDSPTETHILKGILEKKGYNIITATNGKLGIEEAKRSKPDLILMDVVMPDMNGFQATRQLSRDKDTANIPVIIVTTKDQETDKAWGKRQGASAYLVKPVQASELLDEVSTLLAG